MRILNKKTSLQNKLLICIILLLFFSSCSEKIILKNNQKLLYSQRVSGIKIVSRDDIELLYKQKPNKKVFGFPLSLYFYRAGLHRFDTTKIEQKIDALKIEEEKLQKANFTDSVQKQKKIKKLQKKLKKQEKVLQNGNFLMRVVGSKPILYDSSLAQNTKKQIELFYKTKGLFESKVVIKTDTVGNAILVDYKIKEGKQSTISKIKYKIDDSYIKRIINEYLEESILVEKQPFDESNITKERDRIEKLLKNNGYYDFNKKYINFNIDTTNYLCEITCNITQLDNGNPHQLYTIDSIRFDIDQDKNLDYDVDSSTYKDLRVYQSIFFYKPKVLRKKIQLNSNSYYNLSNTQLTQRGLTQLEMFRFVNIMYRKDTSNFKLTPYISATSLSKYQISDELGFTVSQGVPGPFGSVTFTNRNALGGCEIFDISVRGGIEGVASAASPGNVYRSYELGVTGSLTFPRLLSLVDLNKIFLNNNPRTRFSLGYSFILRPEYQRTNTRFSMTYNLQKGNFKSFSLSLIDINYLRSRRIESNFSQYLEELKNDGNNLFRSFQNTIATNLNFGYTYNTFVMGQNKKATFFRIYAEPGGTIFNILTKNQLESIKNSFNLQAVFVYWKINFDLRGYLPITKKSMLASRFHIGIANPYGGDFVLPYEKYFFTGGTNSNRAWLPRRLGPGSFSGNIKDRFEQPGLVLLEMNQEYRFKIFQYFDGAFFIDAGNVWNWNDPDNSKNLKPNFITEIAIGSGLGIRLDFSFLIVRLDAGFKIHDPSKPISARWVASDNLNFKSALWNIAIGYPF